MPDYKRLVSYIYNYEDGMKKNNVGYARVEARNGQCKCTLHIAAPSLNDRQLQVYIFKRRKEGFEGILLGSLAVRNGTGDYRTVTDSLHIMNSSYGLDDMGGIVLYLSERKFFATSWDDAPITLNMVAGINSRKFEPELQAAGVTAEKEKMTPAEKIESEPGERPEEKSGERSEQKTAEKSGEGAEKRASGQSDRSSEQRAAEKSEKSSEEKSGERAENRSAGKSEERAEEESAGKSAKAVTDNIIKVNFRDVHKSAEQTESQNIIESDEYRYQNEGEVFNDRYEGQRPSDNVISDTVKEPQDGEVSVVEVDQTGNKNGEAGKDSSKDEKSKDDSNYIEDWEKLKDELDTPVEILQEEISEPDNTKEREGENSARIQDVNEALEAADDPNLKADRPESGELNPAEMVAPEEAEADAFFADPEEEFNNSDMEPEGFDFQSEVKSEDCRNEVEKQPFFEDHPMAMKIYRSYPRMYPFEDNEVAWCVRIEPQDIGLFPMEAWILGNNSFLLHGYYSYRHLIFARINDRNGFNYILGVPGIYHNREKFMAKMFGFENFKCAKRKAQRTGEFGYWYIPITLS